MSYDPQKVAEEMGERYRYPLHFREVVNILKIALMEARAEGFSDAIDAIDKLAEADGLSADERGGVSLAAIHLSGLAENMWTRQI